jgi:3-carboxy-cis,cis-muconate cycloisomerase
VKMSISPSDSKIFGPQFNHAAIAGIFSDKQYVREMLSVEAALTRVLGKLDVIPAEAAERIVKASAGLEVDLDQLREGTEQSGFPVIELTHQLRAQVGNDAQRYVHWGATTQDIMDTARVLQIRDALDVVELDLQKVIANLAELVRRYRDLVMPGRTHTQHALPITFGYKVASWLEPLLRHRERLAEMKPRVLVLQFGGASGTLAAYGTAVRDLYPALGEELNLNLPSIPWHTQRDGFAEIAGWLSLVSGSLAKMAQDILLLAQSEIGEIRETQDISRGGSSAMPQKTNPIQSELILAAARGNAALLSAMHGALVQEQERGTHGWQLEWIALPQMFALSASALAKAADLSGGLDVDEDRMRANIQASHGTMMAEAIRMALADVLPPADAEELLKNATQTALAESRPLIEIVRESSDVDLEWESLSDESGYLGAAQWFIDRVLQRVGE